MSDTLEREPGFCSGGEDDDIEAEDGIHSPTDASEDSVDVKVQAISLRNKNKRKSAEPRRLDTDLPAKKRKIDLVAVKTEKEESRNSSPFRPWSASPTSQFSREDVLKYSQNGAVSVTKTDPGARYPKSGLGHDLARRLPSLQPSPLKIYPEDLSKVPRLGNDEFSRAQDEPLSLVSKKKDGESDSCGKSLSGSVPRTDKERDDELTWHAPFASQPPKSKDRYSVISRIRNCKTFGDKRARPAVVEGKSKTDEEGPATRYGDNKFGIDSLLSSTKTDGKASGFPGATATAASAAAAAAAAKASQGGQQRNYKNMTRERRIEANARERTRVHTISAAFDTLRHSIPAYSHNQKLSKLSVLRIACSYIMTLSRLAGYDYSKDQSEPDISNCVENVSKTIQTEGKIRKKKDE